MRPIRITVVIGTRPEAIKLMPVIVAARGRPAEFDVSIVRTGQHRDMVDRLMTEFGLEADHDLDVMQPDQDLAHVMSESVRGLSSLFAREKPDWVLVQGDTVTTFAGALAAFYNGVPVGHVEAGLRTGNLHSPFPEEANRSLTARVATLHFAPTESARRNLLGEGIDDDAIVMTGNTVVDALMLTPSRSGESDDFASRGRYILMTAHRRESQGAALRRICDGVTMLLDRHPDVSVWIPMHPSPPVRSVIVERFGGHPRARLTEPLGYHEFLGVLRGAALVLTDSGGVQEECAALGKPVLVLRPETERAEAVDAGVSILVGSDPRRILEVSSGLLADADAYDEMAQRTDAFGAGTASSQILDSLIAVSPARILDARPNDRRRSNHSSPVGS